MTDPRPLADLASLMSQPFAEAYAQLPSSHKRALRRDLGVADPSKLSWEEVFSQLQAIRHAEHLLGIKLTPPEDHP